MSQLGSTPGATTRSELIHPGRGWRPHPQLSRVSCATASGSSSLAVLGALDARRRGRDRLEPLDRDRLAAVVADAVVAALHADERLVDRLDLGLAAIVEPREEARDVLLLRLF